MNFANKKNLSILSYKLIFFNQTSLRKVWLSISHYICLVLTIIDLKIVSKGPIDPIDLFGAQILFIIKTTEDIKIYKNKNLINTIFQIMAPILKYFNNSQKFTVVSFVLYFY